MTVSIERLPTAILTASKQLYRIHRKVNSPWFFDNSPYGRFNPVGRETMGACYWAEEPLGAWVESFRTRMLLTCDDITTRCLTVATLRKDLVVCDLTHRKALRGGVTLALTCGDDYSSAQALADKLCGRVDGVRWRARHDLSGEFSVVALFGRATTPSTNARRTWPKTKTFAIRAELVAEAQENFGYEVLFEPNG